MNAPTRQGIPTLYKGVLMRSRTEARWAAMFDAIGWPWAYEPYDLEGYIPDFLLRLGHVDLLCEVKSHTEDFAAAQAKLDATTYEGQALIVGQTVDGNICGRLREHDGPGWLWTDAEFFFCLSCGEVSILSVEGSWQCRRCGDGHGNAHVGEYDAQGTWNRAGNRVQWRPE